MFAACLSMCCSQLQVLSLSDNDKLSGSLPTCWLSHSSLQELQLAGLSDLHGALPDSTRSSSGSSTGGSSSSSEQLCGFGKLKYVNMAGIIGDAEQGLTGEALLPVRVVEFGAIQCGFRPAASN